MKAVVLTKPTKAEDIVLSDVEIPKVKPGWVLVKIKAFGLNHSEQILREFEIENDYIKKPIIPGIECVICLGRKWERSPKPTLQLGVRCSNV